MAEIRNTIYLQDLWNDEVARKLAGDSLALLRYRSNLLGADLRITNFGGGNTSSKIELSDPFTGAPVRVLAVKGSGGDLGSIQDSGFALLYLDRLEQLKKLYRGEDHEDEMVQYYPLAGFGQNRVAASIDTPLHAFLPFAHVDHLHPDWAVALAASANGKEKLQEFNQRFGRKLAWLPWQRPGFELALQIERAVEAGSGIEGIVLGGHGLFTWGMSQRECYLNSIRTIDQMGEFIQQHQDQKREIFGGLVHDPRVDREEIAIQVLPALRGLLSSNRRVIAHYTDHPDALRFAGSKWSRQLALLGTSCPDHFLRTKVCPMFVSWNPAQEDTDTLKQRLQNEVIEYRREYNRYYESYATPDSPKLRDANPSVVIIPGVGLFGFGKNKREARISTEFFINAIHVMAGANALEAGVAPDCLPQARNTAQSGQFTHFHNYVALPRSEAFRIEYWALEEAKLRRMPAEAEFSGKVALIVGGASGIGREVSLLLARRGIHIVVADFDEFGAGKTARDAAAVSAKEFSVATKADLSSSASLAHAARVAVLQFGGLDVIVNTAAVYPTPHSNGQLAEEDWAKTFLINVTGNSFLLQETEWILRDQNLPATVVLTSSANAVVPKAGSEAYDCSKAALSHLIRELAIRLSPMVRVNGIAPATVVAGSNMFPRERVIQSLQKYQIEFDAAESTEQIRSRLAGFYAQRTVLKQPILPADCAHAVVWLAGDQSQKTTGHVIPVDGGLPEADLR